jgi:hypothetical protein
MVDDSIKAKAITSEKFINEVERLVNKHRLDYMDAVIHFCENNNIEIEQAAVMIRNNIRIKSKLQAQAEELHFLPKRARLPIL